MPGLAFLQGGPKSTSPRHDRRLPAAAAVVVCVAGLAGCGKSGGGETPEKDERARQIARSAQMVRSVVGIYTGRGSRGTGFVVRDKAGKILVVTAAHVVDDGGRVHVLVEEPTPGDARRSLKTAYPEVEVVAADFERDIALLEVQNLPEDRLRPLELAPESCASAVEAWGYPATVFDWKGQLALTQVALSAVSPAKLDVVEFFGNRNRRIKAGVTSGLVVRPRLEKGNSGAPLLDRSGRVVGLVVQQSRIHDQTASVCTSYVVELFDQIESLDRPPSRDEARELVQRVAQTVLPFASKLKDVPMMLTWLLPGRAREYQEFARTRLRQEDPIGRGGGGARARATFLLDALFPNLMEQVEGAGSICGRSAKNIGCVSRYSALPIATEMLRRTLGCRKGITDIAVTTDPTLVNDRKRLYETTVELSCGKNRISSKILVRRALGSLWLDPGSIDEWLKGELSPASRRAHQVAWNRRSPLWTVAWRQNTPYQGYSTTTLGLVRLRLAPRGDDSADVMVWYVYEQQLDKGKFRCSRSKRKRDVIFWGFRPRIVLADAIVLDVVGTSGKLCEQHTPFVPLGAVLLADRRDRLILRVSYASGKRATFKLRPGTSRRHLEPAALDPLFSAVSKLPWPTL